jgi:hypothetical protein
MIWPDMDVAKKSPEVIGTLSFPVGKVDVM